jgi:hypothetical protein
MADKNDNPDTVEEFKEEYSVELATLSEEAQAQVLDAAAEAEFDGELEDVDINDAVNAADQADWSRRDAEDHKEEQFKAEEAGDYAGAREAAEKVEGNLQDADYQGANVDKASTEAGYDVQQLEAAEWQQEIAEGESVEAEAYAEDGDADMAADSAEDAAEGDDYAESLADERDGTDDATRDNTIDYDG